MAKLVFYRQKRYDGGVRTGIELDDDRVADWFESGPNEKALDRALLWYVDLRCEGDGVPDGPELVFDWLHQLGPIIRGGFKAYADHLRHGFDPDIYPLEWNGFESAPPDVAMKIVCSAVRRVDALAMSSVLSEIESGWDTTIEALKAAQLVEELR